MRKVMAGERVVLSASTWNTFVDTAQRSKDASFDLEAQTAPNADGSINVRNDSGYDCPEGGILWTRTQLFEGCRKGERPEYPGIGLFHIAAEPIPNAATGRAWGVGPIARKVRCSDWGTLNVGDDLTMWFDSFEAQKWPLGPMSVIAKDTTPYVWAQITGKRTETVCVHMPNGTHVRVHTIRLKGRFRIADYHDGAPYVGAMLPES